MKDEDKVLLCSSISILLLLSLLSISMILFIDMCLCNINVLFLLELHVFPYIAIYVEDPSGITIHFLKYFDGT